MCTLLFLLNIILSRLSHVDIQEGLGSFILIAIP